MRKKLRLLVAAALLVAVAGTAGWYYWGAARVPEGQPALTSLTAETLPQFRADFNRAADSVRLLVLLSPT